ncbi:Hypothetical predicted protein, partial [Marmota monax]
PELTKVSSCMQHWTTPEGQCSDVAHPRTVTPMTEKGERGGKSHRHPSPWSGEGHEGSTLLTGTYTTTTTV